MIRTHWKCTNVDDQEDYGFTELFFKNASTVIDDYTKHKFLIMQLEYLIPQRKIDNNDKQSDERYQIIMFDNKESHETDQKWKNYEKKWLKI